MAKVSLQNISRKFGNVVAIDNISLNIPDGQFWVLVGSSGCGKSTILRTIAGLETITSGSIYIGDRLVNDVPARQRDVAMVFQNYALYPHMTVADNLAFGLRMRQEKEAVIARKIQEVARSLNLEHLLKRKPKQLSGGQQQRVALGRAIVRQPQVFLLDEPLSNLDAQLRDDTRAELKQLHQREGITTIYVTHDQVEAMTLAEQIVVLQDGRIQQIGSPQAVYARPVNRFVASFLGNPPMNILPASYMEGQLFIGEQGIAISTEIQKQIQLTNGQGCDLGIRPEHIRLVNSESLVSGNAEASTVSTPSISAEDSDSLSIEVELVEPLGRETLVKGRLLESNLEINLIAPANWQEQKGDRVTIQFDLAQLFIFDSSSGGVLYP